MLRSVLLATTILAVGASQALAANILTNGSFENGFTGWSLNSGATGGAPAVVINYGSTASYPIGAFGEAVPTNTSTTHSPDAAGTRAAYFVDDRARPEVLSQSVFLAAGTYEIGFSAYLPQNGFNNVGDASFSASIAGVTLASFNASALTPRIWRSYTGITTIATDGIYAVDFSFTTNRNPSKDVVIDQVYVIASNTAAVPEPASMLLLGAGLLGLGVVRRRSWG